MPDTPKISFIVPVYNVKTYLKACVDSLLRQSCPDFELLLIDDGSTDGSGVLCDALAAGDARVHCTHMANGGVSAARNEGINSAKGEWLCFVDADDWVSEDYASLVAQYGALEMDILLFSYTPVFDGRPPKAHPLPDAAPRPLGRKELTEVQRGILNRYYKGAVDCLAYHVTGPCAKAYRRVTVLAGALSFPRGIISGEDSYFNFCFLDNAARGLLVPAVVYYYRQNRASVTKRYQPGLWESYRQVIALYKARWAVDGRGALYAAQWQEFLVSRVMFIALQDTCHPDNPHPYAERRQRFDTLCREPVFASALQNAELEHFSKAKQMVCGLVRHRCFALLCLLTRLQKAAARFGMSFG